MKDYNFKNKAIDVRGCTKEQKDWINKLIAKIVNVEPMQAPTWYSMAYMRPEHTRVGWNQEDNFSYASYTIVPYKEFLREVNPFRDRLFYVDSLDSNVIQRCRDMGYREGASCREVNKRESIFINDKWSYAKGQMQHPHLTKQQFMMMELPGEIEDKPLVKHDAYLTNGALFYRSGTETRVSRNFADAYKYNLLSEQDFKAKHPDKLKFKEWEVELRDANVVIGCKTFTKRSIKRFHEYSKQILEHASLKEAYEFIDKNKTKLGI